MSRMTNRAALTILAGATALAMTACGGDDGTSDRQASAPSTLATDCGLGQGVLTGMSNAITGYNITGNSEDLKISDGFATADDGALSLYQDPKVRALVESSYANNRTFNEAVESGDDAARQTALDEQQTLIDELLEVCDSALDQGVKDLILRQQEILAEGVKAPANATSTAPSKPKEAPKATAKGTSVTFGEPVFIEVKDRSGKPTIVEFTITGVDKGTDKDKEIIKKEDREEVDNLLYVRAVVKSTVDLSADFNAQPDLTTFDPTLEFYLSDGSRAGVPIMFGTFEPCHDESAEGGQRKLCSLASAPDKSLTVDKVEMTRVDSSDPFTTDPIFTWTRS